LLLEKELGLIERSYYEASVERPPAQKPLAERASADVCVVGGGFSGISAALELAERGFSVVLLEAQRIGWGASGRNGGQAIIGFGSDGEQIIESQLGIDEARRVWNFSVEGLQLLRERIQRYAIECNYTSGYLSAAVKPTKVAMLEKWAAHLRTQYDYPMEFIDPSQIRDWIASDRFHAAIYDSNSGHLHPLRYCLGLAAAARDAGVRIYENSAARVLRRGKKPVIKTALGEVSCDFVVLAGNVYLGEYGNGIAPELASRIVPVGTYIVATQPMPSQRADALLRNRVAVSDTNFILDYFRLSADNRLLFGAGENLTGNTPRHLLSDMRRRLLAVFPQLSDVPIKYAWGGFVDLTLNHAPNFGRLGNNIYYLQGYSGHGLAFSGMAGRLVAEAIAGQAQRFDVISRIRHFPFPTGPWRSAALWLGMWYYRFRDWW
jgi:gamma-glutamylputrescine oxidase